MSDNNLNNIIQITKICTGCGAGKLISQFSVKRSKKRNPYYRSRCKTCENKDATFREKRRCSDPEYRKKRNIRSRKRFKKQSADYQSLAKRRWHLKLRYALSIDAYIGLYQSQGGKCAICRKELVINARSTHVDHDHKTTLVRGILCTQCNSGLGYFKDKTEYLESAIKYLKDREMS